MFREMRRQDRALSMAETQAILTSGTYGVLSLSGGEDDFAYGIPLSYVYLDGNLYFHCAPEGEKLARLQKNNKVSFCVVDKANPLPEKFSIEYSSAIVFGTAEIVSDEDRLKVLLAFVDKYSPDYPKEGAAYATSSQHKCLAIRLTCEHVTGKARKI